MVRDKRVRKAGSGHPVTRLTFVVAPLVAALAAAAGAGCGRTDLDPPFPLPEGNEIPIKDVFTQSVNTDLDIVFMIDNSFSMKEEQDNLARNFPVFISALEALPEGIPNVHIGVVTSDLGSGKYAA